MTTAASLTWKSKGHVSSPMSGCHAVTMPGFPMSWTWAIMRGTVPTGRTGVGFATEEDARTDAERALVEYVTRQGE